MNKLIILVLIIGLTVVSAHRGGRGGKRGGGKRGGGKWGKGGKGDNGADTVDNGVGGNSDDPCSQQGVVFLEAPDIPTQNVEACRQLCEDDANCRFFVFNTFAVIGSDNCGLREFEPSNLVTVNGQRAGFSNLVIENENVVLVGFALETATIEECQASCEGNPRCRSWSWTNADGNNPLLCVHNYGIADTALGVSDTVTSGRKFCDL